MSGHIFDVMIGEVQPASSEKMPGMLRTALTTKTLPSPNVNSAEMEMPQFTLKNDGNIPGKQHLSHLC